jgi:plastocyanin
MTMHPVRLLGLALMSLAASAIIAGCALLIPVAGPGPTSSPVPPSAGTSSAMVQIETRDVSFHPTALTIPASGTSEIFVHNAGRVVHTFTIDALGVQVVVSPGGTDVATIVAPAPGVYEFYCSVSGHKQAGMVGTLTVR